MKEILERIVGLFPVYFEALLSLVSGPKRFVADRLEGDGTSALKNALLFLGITYLLQWVLKAPLERGDPLLALGADTVFVLMLVLCYGTALFLAWRLVGAKMDLRNFFTVHFYFSAIFLVLMSLLFLGMTGTIRMFDPALYAELLEEAHRGNSAIFMTSNSDRLMGNQAYRVSLVVQFVGWLAILMWMFAGWGAYRRLGEVSRARSCAAAAIFMVFCLPVLAITNAIGNAVIK